MSSKHILVYQRDCDIIDINNTNKKNRCIQKKMDYLNCINSYPRQDGEFNEKLQNNKCNHLFWNWYTVCYEPKNKYA